MTGDWQSLATEFLRSIASKQLLAGKPIQNLATALIDLGQ
jgi:hypothetical protein